MMHSPKRYHPAFIAVELFSTIKSLAGPYILVFLVNANSKAGWVIWGRRALFLATIALVLFTISKWVFNRYEVNEKFIIFKEGMFVKKQKTVAWDKIHSHRSNTTFIHRWFGLTSLTLETGTTGDEAEFEFPVITLKEKERIISYLEENGTEAEGEEWIKPQRNVHFEATKKDLIKASFTSLSFLAIFPLLSAVYFNLSDFFELDKSAESAFTYLVGHIAVLIILFLAAMVISILIGFVKTWIKYGKYVISDDEERIYIERGIGNEISFSIAKAKVQAVKMEQTIVQKIFGLVSIKLISAGTSEDEEEISSLYPFMPKHHAYAMLQTILPRYQIIENMERLSIKVLWLKLLQPYYLTIAAVVGIWIFSKEWIWAAAIVFGISIILRILDYWFTSYIRHGQTVQIRQGGWMTETFVTHLHQIQQVTVKHSWIQRKFGIATIKFSNRANPMHESTLFGVSNQEAGTFYKWFRDKGTGSLSRQ